MNSSTTSNPAFPLTKGRVRGYEPSTVDEFLTRARNAFEASSDDALSAADVRRAAFRVVRKGYDIPAVDAALERIEDAFASREREAAIAKQGVTAWVNDHRQLAQEILDRLSRPRKKRFDRAGWLRYGYRRDEVDFVADKIAKHLRSGESLTVEQVRAVAFRMKRGGYRETQVDAVLDAVVQVILAVD